MVWSGVAAAGIGALSSGISALFGGNSAAKQAKHQMNLMAYQNKLLRENNRNAYQDTVYSMREAGINPMLAIGNGVTNQSVGSGGSVSVPTPDNPVSSALDYLSYKMQKKLNDSSVDVNKTQERLNDYLGDKAHEESAYTNELNRQIKEFGPLKQRAELEGIFANTAKILSEINNSNKLTDVQLEGMKIQNIINGRQADWIKKHPIISGGTHGLFSNPSLNGIAAGLAGGSALGAYKIYKNLNKSPVGFR